MVVLFLNEDRIINKINEKQMGKKQIKNFTAEVKTKIVLEMLKEESTTAQLSTKYEVSAKTMKNLSHNKTYNSFSGKIVNRFSNPRLFRLFISKLINHAKQ